METITSRIDNVTGIPLSHRTEIIPPPRSVKVELTSRCNYVCSFCVKSLLPTSDDMKPVLPRGVDALSVAGRGSGRV